MTDYYLVRVFVDTVGAFGNPLAVFGGESDLPAEAKQHVAAELGLSEVVFVDNAVRGLVRIFSPNMELSFAGHPLVGTAWVLSNSGQAVDVLRPPAGEVATWGDGSLTWIRASSRWLPDWEHVELPSAAAVTALRDVSPRHDLTQFWAWEDESAGTIRARVFAPRMGIPEDEACGSASLMLAHRLARPLVISHGAGSVILARPGPGDTVELGGRVVLDEVREYRLRTAPD